MAADSKKYYWLKLPEGFFGEKVIKKLRRSEDGKGDTYTVIYLKMLLKSLSQDGSLFFEGIEEDFETELALDIEEEVEDVKATVAFLMSKGLIDERAGEEYHLFHTDLMTGSETEAASRMRNKRQNAAVKEQFKAKSEQCSNNVQECSDNVQRCSLEIEIEKEIDKELDSVVVVKDNTTHTRTRKGIAAKAATTTTGCNKVSIKREEEDDPPGDLIPPSKEDVESFVKANSLNVNVSKFYVYYSKMHWKFRGKAVDWKECAKNWDKTEALDAAAEIKHVNKSPPKKSKGWDFPQRDDVFELEKSFFDKVDSRKEKVK